MAAVIRLPTRPPPAPPARQRSRAGAPWERHEDVHLAWLRRAGLTCREVANAVKIAAEDWGRPIGEVCRRFDFLLGPEAVRAGSLTSTERALYVLAGRAEESPGAPGGFTLDGRPAEWRDVARAANAVLIAGGKAPIAVPEDGP